MQDYDTYFLSKQKNIPVAANVEKTLKQPEISVKIAGVICSTSPDNCRKITDDNI